LRPNSGDPYRRQPRTLSAMDPREHIAMLTAHGVRIGHIPGGVVSLTAQDIAAAIGAALNREEASFLLARYADDMQQLIEAQRAWRVRVHREAKERGWRSEKVERFCYLADATLEEWLSDSNCRLCKGVGTQPDKFGVITDCPVCEGTRKQYPSERAMARALGNISVQAYRETWGSRVAWCRRWLYMMEADATSRIGKKLRP
jgi:hypothetical protein